MKNPSKVKPKKLEKKRKDAMRAIQEVQYLINRDFREETRERGRNCQTRCISLGSREKWINRRYIYCENQQRKLK